MPNCFGMQTHGASFPRQISVDVSEVDYSGTCGNLASAVGVFAVEEGLVSPEVGHASVAVR